MSPTAMQPATPRPGTHDFSLLRRHSRSLALGEHVSRELIGGRGLFDILDDEFVRTALHEMPWLTEDLMSDQRVCELLDRDPVDMRGGQPVLIYYDGGPSSRAAVETAGDLFPGAPAVILAVWRPAGERAAIRTAGHRATYARPRRTASDVNAGAASAAAAIARQGSDLAHRTGLRPRPLTVPAADFEHALARVAAEWGARAIVIGPVRRTLLGRLFSEPRIDAGRLAAATHVPVVKATTPGAVADTKADLPDECDREMLAGSERRANGLALA